MTYVQACIYLVHERKGNNIYEVEYVSSAYFEINKKGICVILLYNVLYLSILLYTAPLRVVIGAHGN